MEIQKKSVNGVTTLESTFAGKKFIIESGLLAGQTNASCTVRLGDTVVLATAVMSDQPREGVDFFPLMVDVEERLYAAGKIKGSRWIKREGRPSDEAVVTGRVVDRSIRPLFPNNFFYDVQVILTVLSVDNENDSDIVGLIAASCVLAISDIPWLGPIGGVRLGYIQDEANPENYDWVINPTFAQREKSKLEMIMSGTHNKVLMIEANANEAEEQTVVEGIVFSQPYIKELIDVINTLTKDIGKKKFQPQNTLDISEEESKEISEDDVTAKANAWIEKHVPNALFEKPLLTKTERISATKKLQGDLMAYLEKEGVGRERRKKADGLVSECIEEIVSKSILKDERRVDGRTLTEIRKLTANVGILPRTHGSGLFSRGETQVLSVVTLGAPGEEQMLEGIETNGKKRYMHHYNFPSYSVGETGPLRATGRREIGHGALAERALVPMLPLKEAFPYIIRVVSEVLSSNGSSSMASVCGSTLSLMDAGVPIRKPVAGVAMGLASDSDGNYKILTDLQDLEDGEGGMDFKVAGTRDGITVIQLDTKTKGLSIDICKKTLEQAKVARNEILDIIEKTIAKPRENLSQYAPRITTIKIDPKKIRDVIGTGGKVINEIVEKTGVQIEIEQDGTIFISAVSEEASKKALDIINDITREIKQGEIISGKVVRILDFGAIVQLTQNRDGMVHISELAPYRVNKVEDVIKLGDTVTVKVLHVDDQGKIGLSIKALSQANSSGDDNSFSRPNSSRDHAQRHDRGTDKRHFRR